MKGKNLISMEYIIDEEGYLFLPLRIYLPEEGALNLIPVDYFVNATIKDNCQSIFQRNLSFNK